MQNEIEVPGFMTYREAAIMFSLMDEKSAAKAIKATVGYFLYGEEPKLDGVAQKVFEIMKADIDRNEGKYLEIRQKNRENAGKRWRKQTGGG